jgi:hypothetical protein
MFTHQLPPDSIVRQKREELYAQWPAEQRQELERIACGHYDRAGKFLEPSNQAARALFRWLLDDYTAWVKDREEKKAA